MRLLVTRGAEDAARTSAALIARGHEAVVSPVIVFSGMPTTWPPGVVDALVATSAKALRHADLSGLQAEVRRVLPQFFVGRRTAEVADGLALAGARTVMPDVEPLAECLVRDHARRIVYLAGADRTPDVEQALDAAGKTVLVVETYRAIALEYLSQRAADAFARRAIDGVLHFSPRSARLFLQQMENTGQDPRRVRHYCLSEKVAKPLQSAGCKTIETAKAPDERALLDLIER